MQISGTGHSLGPSTGRTAGSAYSFSGSDVNNDASVRSGRDKGAFTAGNSASGRAERTKALSGKSLLAVGASVIETATTAPVGVAGAESAAARSVTETPGRTTDPGLAGTDAAASATSSVMAKPSYVHAETIAPLSLIVAP